MDARCRGVGLRFVCALGLKQVFMLCPSILLSLRFGGTIPTRILHSDAVESPTETLPLLGTRVDFDSSTDTSGWPRMLHLVKMYQPKHLRAPEDHIFVDLFSMCSCSRAVTWTMTVGGLNYSAWRGNMHSCQVIMFHARFCRWRASDSVW